MLKTSPPPHLWKGRVLECYCKQKVLWDIHALVSLVNEQKSQDRKKSTSKFYLRKGDDLVAKGGTQIKTGVLLQVDELLWSCDSCSLTSKGQAENTLQQVTVSSL